MDASKAELYGYKQGFGRVFGMLLHDGLGIIA